VESVDVQEARDAEHQFQQQAYTDDSGDTVSRSDEEQNEYEITESIDQTSITDTPSHALDIEQQPLGEVSQEDATYLRSQEADVYNERHSYDNDDDNDDYEEATRYRKVYDDQQQFTESEQNNPEPSYVADQEEQYNAAEDIYQDHQSYETEHSYQDGPQQNYQDHLQEIEELDEPSNYEPQETTVGFNQEIEQHSIETGCVQSYGEPAAYGEQHCDEIGSVQHYDEPAAYGDAAENQQVLEEHQFYNEQIASEAVSDERLAKHGEDFSQTAYCNQQYVEECQPRVADEHKQVKFLAENGNSTNRYNDTRRTWEDAASREQERRQSPERERNSPGYDNEDEHNQNDEHPIAERGRIKVLLAQWRQFEQQMSLSTGSARSPASRDSHARSRSCGPARRRNVVTNIYENKCSDDIATEINSNGRRSRWDEEEDEDENHIANRAAILAKFENLEAQAHKTAIVTKKRVNIKCCYYL
jgi:hypothetical protein